MSRLRISLIQIPYDSGHANARMGAGPSALIARGLADKLRATSEVHALELHLAPAFHAEAAALVALQRAATAAARETVARGARPFFLSGNCGTAALSACATLTATDTGVIWFDAHGDCNTPETSASGFLDGMCLAILTGQCWRKLAARFDNFTPIPGGQIVQIGARDVDPEENSLLDSLGVVRIAAQELDRFPAALHQLRRRTKQLYVHLDADVLDISEGAANSYARAGGLTHQQLYECLRLIANTGAISAVSITSYEPASDPDARVAKILIEAASILGS
jgi:arginase